MKKPIMAHLVIGYPSLAESRAIAETHIQQGVEILELQIPFSHPTADGSVLSKANQDAVASGTTLLDSLDFIGQLKTDFPQQTMIAMTYLNKIFSFGIEHFCNALKVIGIQHVIVPDLPFDSPLVEMMRGKIQLVPVIAANISEERLQKILGLKPDFIYIMADYKITGSQFSIHERIAKLVQKIKANCSAKVGLGFGISNGQQVKAVLEVADFAIIGSAFTRAIDEGKLEERYGEIVG